MRVRRLPYIIIPIQAFRSGKDFEVEKLPISAAQRSWKRVAVALLVISGFVFFLIGMVTLEEALWPDSEKDSLAGFYTFMWCVAFLLLFSATWCWIRIDKVKLDQNRVGVSRQGLLGTMRHHAALSEYCVRATSNYAEDFEATSGTFHWSILLEHKDPALTIELFSRSEDVSSKEAPILPSDRPDWTPQMRELAKQWSEKLELPLRID